MNHKGYCMKKIAVILFFLFLFYFPCLSLSKEEETITDISFFQKDENFTLGFLVNGCMNEKIKEATKEK